MMLETIKVLQQNIQGNKKELDLLYRSMNPNDDADTIDARYERINILVGENMGLMTALALIKRDFTEATDFINDFEPRLGIS